MTSVRCILVETTVPVRIRPRMETSPVKGHFLSVRAPCQPLPHPNLHYGRRTNVIALDGCLGCLEAQSDVFIPSSLALTDSSVLAALGALVLGVEEDVRLLLISTLALNC